VGPATWYGTSRRKPKVTRFRDEDGWYGLHVVCWHGVEADLVYPVKATIASWEQSASLIPCQWTRCGIVDVRRSRYQPPAQTTVTSFWDNLED
jgi:hypothetical protein